MMAVAGATALKQASPTTGAAVELHKDVDSVRVCGLIPMRARVFEPEALQSNKRMEGQA